MKVKLESLQAALDGIEAELGDRGKGKLFQYFPESGPYRRALYPKHLAFFEAGKTFRERGAISANRVGKSVMAAYETALHLTGSYPEWWPGRKFSQPVRWWVCGDTSSTVRDIMQEHLMGPWGSFGTGFIPRHAILHQAMKRGVANAIDTVWVRHASGGRSQLQFKGYEAGRIAFQGTSQHGVELDEEPPYDIYEECLLRTAKTSDFPGGMLMLTFTPLKGLTDVVREFYPRSIASKDKGESGTVPGKAKRWRVRITWDDVPHISEEEKEDFLSRLRPYQREARTRGVPQLGSGAVYPFPVSEIRVPDMEIPSHWSRGWALDAQALWKSSLHVALDRETGILYVYGEYKRELATTADHAQAIRERGAWIPGVGDAMGLVQEGERTQYIDLYRGLGLDIVRAEKSVEAGIQDVYDTIAKGKLKVFASCVQFFDEYETYQRDEKGRIVKSNDHLMDCLRMVVRADKARGENWMVTAAEAQPEADDFQDRDVWHEDDRTAWMR